MREIALMELIDALERIPVDNQLPLEVRDPERCIYCAKNVMHEQHEHDNQVAGHVRKPQKHQSRAERERKAREYRQWYKRTH